MVEYEEKVRALIEGVDRATAVAAMRAEGLVFTLADILSDTGACPRAGDAGGKLELAKDDPIVGDDVTAMGLSDHATLRVGYGQRAILDEGVFGTRAQCVLGLHDYRDPVCYTDQVTLEAASSSGVVMDTDGSVTALTCSTGIPATPPDGYIKDPALNLHITEIRSEEGTGYRWRNGALTVQLLDVGTFTLQNPAWLPKKGSKRFGGTFAQAFTVAKVTGKDLVTADNTTKGADESGLLYEATMYWHYSALADGLRTAEPASTPCYGDPNWKSRISIELGGLTLGEYQALTNPLIDECETWDEEAEGRPCPLEEFAALLGLIEAAEDEDELASLLLTLADLLDGHPDLAKYAKYREYAPGHVPEHKLLPWDVDPTDPDRDKSGDDAIPAKVISIETIDLETKGPITKEGTVIWTDIRQ